MNQETLNKVNEYAPQLVLLDPRVIFASICNDKYRMALLESIYADMNREHERYLEQIKEWEKTKEKLEKRKTRNVKVEKELG